MKVKVKGFSLSFTKEVSSADFFQELERLESKEISVPGKKLFFYTHIINNLIVGLTLRYRENKKTIITEGQNNDLEIKINKLKPGQHGTEVSLFTINPNTLHGVFYSYTGSATGNDYKHLFYKAFKSTLAQKRKDKAKELTDFGREDVKNLNKKLDQLLPQSFDFKLLATDSDLSTILSKYNEISKISLKATNALMNSGTFTPLSEISRNCKRIYLTINFI